MDLDRFLDGVADDTATALGVLAARWSSNPQQPDATKLIVRSWFVHSEWWPQPAATATRKRDEYSLLECHSPDRS
jgi:hypothetical protein